MPSYPARDAERLMNVVLEEIMDEGGFNLSDAADEGWLMPRGEGVVLRVGMRPAILLRVSTIDRPQEDECTCGATTEPGEGHHPDCDLY